MKTCRRIDIQKEQKREREICLCVLERGGGGGGGWSARYMEWGGRKETFTISSTFLVCHVYSLWDQSEEIFENLVFKEELFLAFVLEIRLVI